MTHIKLVFKYAFLDMRKQKIRTILAVFGMLISIGLLTVVLFLSDSISAGYVDFLSIDSGNQDAIISVRHYNGEPENRSSYFEYEPLIQTIENTTNIIENYVPRLEIEGDVNISEGFYTTALTDEEVWCTISAINFSFENSINFGVFTEPLYNELLDLNELPLNHCAIYYRFNDFIKYSEGDTIDIKLNLTHEGKTYNRTLTMTIDQIFDYNLKWPAGYRNDNLIVVDINTLYQFFGINDFEGKCSDLILTFKQGNTLYDIRDLEGTDILVKSLVSDIQIAIGINEYTIDLPKLRILGWAEFLSVFIVIVFVFVSIIAILISGVLINGILKTSVEERIREFGIFRTLGSSKKFNLAIVLMQGFLLCNFGALSGIITAYVLSRFLIIPFANSVIAQSTLGFSQIPFSFTWGSVIITYIMGISVGLIVSISPALKVMRLQLIESIHPYRHEDTLYHLQKKATVNYKLILVGIILAFNGGFVFYVIPRIMVSTDMALLAGTLVAILLIFNIGLTLAGLGLIPVILRLVIELFRPLAKRLHSTIKIFVFRYQRRNSSTTIIFALSFSFVIFTSSLINTLSSQSTASTKIAYGSDLLIVTTGWEESERGGRGGGFSFMANEGSNANEGLEPRMTQNYDVSIKPTKIITTEFEEDLMAIDGIEKVSSVLARPYQLTQIYAEENKEFTAEIGDYTGLTTQGITLIGIDEEYPFTVRREFIDMTSGNIESSFQNLFENNQSYTCIISEAISIAMSLLIGDNVRIVIYRGDEMEVYPFLIIGTAKSMPGFSREFSGSSMGASMGGVLISQETYIEIMDIPPVPYLDRIFIKLREDKLSEARHIEEFIDETYEMNYNYDISNLARMVAQQESAFFVLDTLFTLIALTTVFICIFGLLASSYSTIIERKKEIGIIRTLGLKGREINRLFILESLIIMISSGTIGIIVGWLTSWLVSSQLMGTLMGMPTVLYIPIFNIILIYSLSIAMIYFGMKLLLRKARKQKIVEIYRESM
ncbi:MAG: FtsX-like permease family protein [Candidatus Lokiarchaeota archaeon]|nr:FtsX-like permease family protein [Candidatus Lokiarchaeota archaeon]